MFRLGRDVCWVIFCADSYLYIEHLNRSYIHSRIRWVKSHCKRSNNSTHNSWNNPRFEDCLGIVVTCVHSHWNDCRRKGLQARGDHSQWSYRWWPHQAPELYWSHGYTTRWSWGTPRHRRQSRWCSRWSHRCASSQFPRPEDPPRLSQGRGRRVGQNQIEKWSISQGVRTKSWITYLKPCLSSTYYALSWSWTSYNTKVLPVGSISLWRRHLQRLPYHSTPRL